MKYSRLVVNGCSYMESYASGNGHVDLAQQLGIEKVESLAIGGSANNRIIRTTLKDSYITTEPTVYVIGMTFVLRTEIPILKLVGVHTEFDDNTFEGRWTNPQNQYFVKDWLHFWKESDTDTFVNLWFKSNTHGLLDQVEDLMYRFLSFIGDLTRRGHGVLIFNQADLALTADRPNEKKFLDVEKIKLLKETKNFVHGLSWAAIPWQHEQGVPSTVYREGMVFKYGAPPENVKHRQPGAHQKLNEYLINYINEYKILE